MWRLPCQGPDPGRRGHDGRQPHLPLARHGEGRLLDGRTILQTRQRYGVLLGLKRTGTSEGQTAVAIGMEQVGGHRTRHRHTDRSGAIARGPRSNFSLFAPRFTGTRDGKTVRPSSLTDSPRGATASSKEISNPRGAGGGEGGGMGYVRGSRTATVVLGGRFSLSMADEDQCVQGWKRGGTPSP